MGERYFRRPSRPAARSNVPIAPRAPVSFPSGRRSALQRIASVGRRPVAALLDPQPLAHLTVRDFAVAPIPHGFDGGGRLGGGKANAVAHLKARLLQVRLEFLGSNEHVELMEVGLGRGGGGPVLRE